jgi:hypothetical protein
MYLLSDFDDSNASRRAEFGRKRGSKNKVRKTPTLRGHITKGAKRGAIAGSVLGGLGNAVAGASLGSVIGGRKGALAGALGGGAFGATGGAISGAVNGGVLGAGIYGGRKLSGKLKKKR